MPHVPSGLRFGIVKLGSLRSPQRGVQPKVEAFAEQNLPPSPLMRRNIRLNVRPHIDPQTAPQIHPHMTDLEL
jgi:hypothetical protein